MKDGSTRIIGLACESVTSRVANAVMGDDQFHMTNRWPTVLGFGIAAAVCRPVGLAMNPGGRRQFPTPPCEPLAFPQPKGRHSLFFMPVQHWWAIFLAIAVWSAIFPWRKI